MRAVVAACALLAGCFFKPDRPGAGQDAARDSTTGDGAADVCPHPGAWSGPQAIASANTAMTEQNPTLSPDGKHLVFVRGDNQSTTLYMIPVTGTSFGSAALLPFGSDVNEPAWSPAGDRLYFAVSGADWKYATFDGTNFGSATSTVELAVLNPRIEGGPSFDGDGTELYYDANGHIYHATGSVGGSWTGATEVTDIALPAGESSAEISRDGLEIYYSHAAANNEVWVATRADRSAHFSAGSAVPNQVDGERPTISTSRTLLVYNGADFDLYFATRSCQ